MLESEAVDEGDKVGEGEGDGKQITFLFNILVPLFTLVRLNCIF